jgi:hypothetical protein
MINILFRFIGGVTIIKLRIPLLLMSLGIVSGILQFFHTYFNNVVYNSLFFIIIVLLYLSFEKFQINEKNMRLPYGVLLVIVGGVVDLLTSLAI